MAETHHAQEKSLGFDMGVVYSCLRMYNFAPEFSFKHAQTEPKDLPQIPPHVFWHEPQGNTSTIYGTAGIESSQCTVNTLIKRDLIRVTERIPLPWSCPLWPHFLALSLSLSTVHKAKKKKLLQAVLRCQIFFWVLAFREHYRQTAFHQLPVPIQSMRWRPGLNKSWIRFKKSFQVKRSDKDRKERYDVWLLTCTPNPENTDFFSRIHKLHDVVFGLVWSPNQTSLKTLHGLVYSCLPDPIQWA